MALRVPRSWRAGERHLFWNDAGLAAPETIAVGLPSLGADGALARENAGPGVGDNVAPPVEWTGAPAEARALWLVVEDPDVPIPRPIVHVSALIRAAPSGALARGALNEGSGAAGVTLLGGMLGRVGWQGPRPIPDHGPHAYVFQLFALDLDPALDPSPGIRTARAARKEFAGHVIARGRVTGTYEQTRAG